MSNLGRLRPRPGDVVERVYHVKCELGSDAASAVLGAIVPATGKRYALRCWLDDDGAKAAVATQHFVRVANAIGLFAQPGVVEVYGVGRTNGVFYSVTEWLEGTTLQRFLERNGQLSASDTLSVILPCLEGLAAAHAGGITHGDVRPANVFVCRPTPAEPERARLGKFECGDWPEKSPEIRRRISTDLAQRQFISPEELQGAVGDARSDVYSVGILLYVMLAGRSPFSAYGLSELDREIMAGACRPVSDCVASVSPGLSNVIARAMALDPDERFHDMTAMLALLKPLQTQGSHALVEYELVTRYRWIRPVAESEHSSLFDSPASDLDDVAARRHAGFSRVLRACLVLSLGLLSATMLHRVYVQREAPLLSEKQRRVMLARPEESNPDTSLSFSPLPVPAQIEPVTTLDPKDTVQVPHARPQLPTTPRVVTSNGPSDTRPASPPPAAANERNASPVMASPATAPPARPAPAPRSADVQGAAPPNQPGVTAVTSSSSAPLTNRHAEVLGGMQLQ